MLNLRLNKDLTVLTEKSTKKIDTTVRKVAETLQIEPLLKRYPNQLSGGQKQRAAKIKINRISRCEKNYN